MIGFFDSGLGGLTILKDVLTLLPEHDYIYLGDNLRAPYGSKPEELIYEHTREGVRFMFEQGAELVVLACNTASAVALRRLQQEFLPAYFPDKKILGIVIPTIEEARRFSANGHLGLLATEATVASNVYSREISKLNPDLKISSQGCPALVPLIEQGRVAGEEIENEIRACLSRLLKQDREIDTIMLGCTHYALIKELIEKHLPFGIKAISQGRIIAMKLKDYLIRHSEIERRLGRNGGALFLTTAEATEVSRLAGRLFGASLEFKTVQL